MNYGRRGYDTDRSYGRRERNYNDYRSDYASSNRYGGYTPSWYSYGRGSEPLRVTNTYMFIKENTHEHHTNEFDIANHVYGVSRPVLVVRRGQKFYMWIQFNRTYDSTRDGLRLVFQFGKETEIKVSLPAKSKYDANSWNASIERQHGESVTVSVEPPPTCPVGKWTLGIDVVKPVAYGTPEVLKGGYRSHIYILFNPWCRNDPVFMREEHLLGEYILNETGKIYGGSVHNFTTFPWNFGQFSGVVLDAVLYLLERSGLPDDARGDPVQVSRRISSLVNSNDDNGVLVGKWQEPYSDGTSPLDWTGSVKILTEYYKTKRSVKYGQCWVFSGIVTTACRALGIPARSVTNFLSAHDTDGSMTIDRYVDTNFEPIKHLNKDSDWNFHVWNDIWTARPDLPPGYGGWQAVDATPQEKSGGVFCMGPTSLAAIKHGHVNLRYDGPFAFAEVNGDKTTWMLYPGGKRRAIEIDKGVIGKNISTKRPFVEDGREDVTHEYKFREGTTEERMAVQRATGKPVTDSSENENTNKEVEFELNADNNTFIGEPLHMRLRVKNRSRQKRTITGNVRVTTMHYWGETFKPVIKGNLPGTPLEPNEEKSFYMEVQPDSYLGKLADHCFLEISGSNTVEETNQIFSKTIQVRLRKPHLNIEAPNTGYVGQKFTVRASFRNPLKQRLTNCRLRVEGPGKQEPDTYYLREEIQTGQTFAIEMTPVKTGVKEIIINFSCDQIYNVNASHRIEIR